MRRLATNILMTATLIVLFTAPARSQGAEEIDARNAAFVQLYGQGKYAEAAATAFAPTIPTISTDPHFA